MMPVTLLCLNFTTGLGTRYERIAGNKARPISTPRISIGNREPLGCDEARALIEKFRVTGGIL